MRPDLPALGQRDLVNEVARRQLPVEDQRAQPLRHPIVQGDAAERDHLLTERPPVPEGGGRRERTTRHGEAIAAVVTTQRATEAAQSSTSKPPYYEDYRIFSEFAMTFR